MHWNISFEKPPKCSFICNWFAMLGITWNKYFQFRGWTSSWHYWEEVREAPTRNCTNDCSCCDEANDQPVIHPLRYMLCIDWKSLKAPWVKDIDVAHWNIKKQQMRANWNSYIFHSQHLEMYIRFEHYSLPTPTMLTWLTLNINSLKPSNATHELVVTLLNVWPMGSGKFCFAVEERIGPSMSNLPLSVSQKKGICIVLQHCFLDICIKRLKQACVKVPSSNAFKNVLSRVRLPLPRHSWPSGQLYLCLHSGDTWQSTQT